jgi:hypothetical protein
MKTYGHLCNLVFTMETVICEVRDEAEERIDCLKVATVTDCVRCDG